MVDPLIPSKVLQDSTLTEPHLATPGAIRTRPVFAQCSIPSVHINHRLQARLQRIRMLAAAEMEKKEAVLQMGQVIIYTKNNYLILLDISAAVDFTKRGVKLFFFKLNKNHFFIALNVLSFFKYT